MAAPKALARIFDKNTDADESWGVHPGTATQETMQARFPLRMVIFIDPLHRLSFEDAGAYKNYN
ncbi:hypothetical protein [Pareuzebyella sediminis]|uniref:hypothetical protein n=1 Tax=Pareuzebyella sediminis TaxID=2607998 RepID=UPI0011EC34C2|nr:hypothetical protein [Pareuzebyella sediminis]